MVDQEPSHRVDGVGGAARFQWGSSAVNGRQQAGYADSVTTSAAAIVVLSMLSAACGLVAVAAMVAQRIGSNAAQKRLDESIVIDGGSLGDDSPPSEHHLESHIARLVALQRPGMTAIIFASLTVVLGIAASILGLTSAT